jgi:uncharacterized protein YheU (UPF0270 family)
MGTEEESADAGPPVEVPHGELAPETLRRVIESFVLREGSDYGEQERSFDSKIADVLRQLDRREAVIMFDPATESVGIVVKRPGG